VTAPETETVPPTNPPATPDATFSEPVRDAAYESLFAPPTPGTVTAAARQPAEPQPSPEPTAPAGHEIWAPPEDRGDR
jgi:hypothetical protein